jgi:hypothetical protein
MPSMKPGALHVVAALAAALVCGSSLAGLLAAQSAKVESEDGVVTVTLLVETTTGSQATLRARDGRKVTISEANGEAVALTPALMGDQLEVRITDLSVAGTELEMTPVTLVRGVPATLGGMPAVSKVTWVSLTVSNGSSPQGAQCDVSAGASAVPGVSLAPSQPDSPCSFCCVSCGGVLYCGCGVITSCGACCCPNECSC